MLTNSCPTSMSKQPGGGHGRLCSISQMPERSGLPSGVRGTGAVKSGFPSGVRGTPAVGYFNHCADAAPDTAHTRAMLTMTILIATSAFDRRLSGEYSGEEDTDTVRFEKRKMGSGRTLNPEP